MASFGSGIVTLVGALALVPLGYHVRIENSECPETGADLLQAILWQQRVGADDHPLGWVVHHRDGTTLQKFEDAVIDMIMTRFAPAACPIPTRSAE